MSRAPPIKIRPIHEKFTWILAQKSAYSTQARLLLVNVQQFQSPRRKSGEHISSLMLV